MRPSIKGYDKRKIIGTTTGFVLRYNFYQDKFCSADLETNMDVLPALVSLYNSASQAGSVKQQYWWIGKTATLQKVLDAAS